MTWHGARVRALRQLAESGLSAAAIATALGDGITRSAVISKCHRERITLQGRARGKLGLPEQLVRLEARCARQEVRIVFLEQLIAAIGDDHLALMDRLDGGMPEPRRVHASLRVVGGTER
jgi:hypothetical protein